MSWSYELWNTQRVKKNILIRKRMAETSSCELTFSAKQANMSFPCHMHRSRRVSFSDFDSLSLPLPNDHFIIMNFSSLHWSVVVSVCSCACLHLSPPPTPSPCVACQVIVHEVPGQELEVEVFDKDPDQDDFLGRYFSLYPCPITLRAMLLSVWAQSTTSATLQAERPSSHRAESHFVRWSDGRPCCSHGL